jgi:Ca-activated chloride channel family protein
MLTDVTLGLGAVTVEEIYPYPLPDLFAGGQLVVVGRYRLPADANAVTTITLRGRAEGREATYRYAGMRFTAEGGADFIPRLWATRKIGYLLTQIRLHGAQRELVDEIVVLSVRYGIVTPYTSFLIDETEDALSPEGRDAIVGREMKAMPSATIRTAPLADLGRGGAGGPASGEAAVQNSIAQEAMRKADAVAEPQSERVKTVGPKAFVLRDGVWVDTTYDAATMTPQWVAFASERYFALLRAHPDWGRYLAVGERVILVWEGRAYAFDETGEMRVGAGHTGSGPPAVRPTAWRVTLGAHRRARPTRVGASPAARIGVRALRWWEQFVRP